MMYVKPEMGQDVNKQLEYLARSYKKQEWTGADLKILLTEYADFVCELHKRRAESEHAEKQGYIQKYNRISEENARLKAEVNRLNNELINIKVQNGIF